MRTAAPSTVTGWREFLSSRGIGCLSSDTLREAEADRPAEWMLTDAQRDEGRLGFEPAAEESLQALERRLGVRLPRTYRSFLATSNGWSSMAGGVNLLAVEQVDWFTKLTSKLLTIWSEPGMKFFVGNLEAFDRCVLISEMDDRDYFLLDPGRVGDDGEWAAYEWNEREGVELDRYASFGALVTARSASIS
ncbi:SMI1/KNR4 family protein [Amycolatopsis pretoriensis]|nr:SMI1/KNR4 family protein [Amycolatopsis pretoriensis]